MDKNTFVEHFVRGHSVGMGRRTRRHYVEERLPNEMRFRVRLNSPYDGNPLHPDEDYVRSPEQVVG
jgi:hypothetical protein